MSDNKRNWAMRDSNKEGSGGQDRNPEQESFITSLELLILLVVAIAFLAFYLVLQVLLQQHQLDASWLAMQNKIMSITDLYDDEDIEDYLSDVEDEEEHVTEDEEHVEEAEDAEVFLDCLPDYGHLQEQIKSKLVFFFRDLELLVSSSAVAREVDPCAFQTANESEEAVGQEEEEEDESEEEEGLKET